MPLIDISNLTFAYDGSFDNVFENVSFRIDSDWKLGFTGRNGRGKTTFLNLLLGKYEYKGTISSDIPFDYFPFDVEDPTADTIDVIKRIVPCRERWEVEREGFLLSLAEDALCRPFETLSKGEQTKALLAALFLKEDRFLLIDEPTNHLDLQSRTAVADYLRSKKGFILVSHDRAFLDACVDHILSINKTNIEIQKGNFSSWWENKKKQDAFELAEDCKLKKDIRRLNEAKRRTADWSDKTEKTKYATKNSGLRPDRGYIGHKAAKLMQRSKSIEARQQAEIEEKSRLLKNIEESESLKISPLCYHANRLLILDKAALFYGDKRVCDAVSFTVERGDRVAVCGRNGSGKSSLLKLICGGKIDYTGTFQKGSNLVLSSVSQDTSFLKGSLARFAVDSGIDDSLFRAILRKLDFSRVQFEKDMADFSEGQKKKVLIARSLCEKAHLYIWDEPLNFIDVISRMQIEELLLRYKPTILFVEHDAAFCERIATKRVFL